MRPKKMQEPGSVYLGIDRKWFLENNGPLPVEVKPQKLRLPAGKGGEKKKDEN